MFYKFFKVNGFGNNSSIVTCFSILPPIIRHITLELLFEDNRQDYFVIEKLLLAKVKAFDFKSAEQWLLEQRDEFEKITISMAKEDQDKLFCALGEEMAKAIICQNEENLFDVLNNKLIVMKKADYKPLYTNFEEAASYYRSNGIVEGDKYEVKEFNDLMEFVYIGRCEKLYLGQTEENYILEKVIWHLNTDN